MRLGGHDALRKNVLPIRSDGEAGLIRKNDTRNLVNEVL